VRAEHAGRSVARRRETAGAGDERLEGGGDQFRRTVVRERRFDPGGPDAVIEVCARSASIASPMDTGPIVAGWSGSWAEEARETGAVGVASVTCAGMTRQQFAARSEPFDSLALGASHREHASVRAGIFMRQSIRPARAGGACARRSAPRTRIERMRRAFMSPQSTRRMGDCDNWFVGSIGTRAPVPHGSEVSESRDNRPYFNSFDNRRSLSGTPPV
jgi:hypothetical protein